MKRNLLSALAAICLLALTAPAFTEDWTRFRGPNGTGLSEASDIPVKWTDKDYNWKTDFPGVGHSQPVAWGEKIFLTSAEKKGVVRHVLCFSTLDGSILWKKTYDNRTHGKHRLNSFASSTPAVSKDALYVMFGNPETTSGGNALKFYSSVRLDIRRIGAIKDRDDVVGNQTRVKVVKNKVAPPFKVVEFDIMYGEGISKTGELLDHGVNAGIVEKSGSWFSYDSQRIGQGRENAKRFLLENPEVADTIELRVRENAGLLAESMLKGNQEETAAVVEDDGVQEGVAD